MKILFVCTGNVFRSMSAEYCLRDYFTRNGIADIEVSSAGIRACKPHEIDAGVKEALMEFDIDSKVHIPRQLSKEIIDENDLVVAMSINHFEYIKKNFGIEVPLFKEIAFGQKEAMLDNCEVFDDINDKNVEKEVMEYNASMVKYIHEVIEKIAKNYKIFI